MMPIVSGTRRHAVRRAALPAAAFLAALAGCQSITVEDRRDYRIESENQESILDSRLKKLEGEVEKYPKRHDLHYDIAGIHYQRGDFREAVEALEQALRIVPDDPRYHYQLGRVYLHMKEVDAAEKEFRTAIALLPPGRYTGFHAALGHVLALKKDVPGALAEFEKCRQIEPEKPLYYYYLGSLHDMRGDREKTIHYLTEYLDRGDTTYQKRAEFILERLGVIVEKPASHKEETGEPFLGNARKAERTAEGAGLREALAPAAALPEPPPFEDLHLPEAMKD